MKGLLNLIRVHRWRLDEKRRELVELELLAEDLVNQGRQLEINLKDEQALARTDVESGFTYGGYARSVIERREKLADSLDQIGERISTANDEVQELFREVKSYEILQETSERKAEEKEARMEQETLDELGGEVFRRRRKAV
ncbi:MAG: flagellar FliJ family protein [Alphaproteobacteria bacterium]|nr:flagellar FliJ family protein [Alphaproteobacteria bacterium]